MSMYEFKTEAVVHELKDCENVKCTSKAFRPVDGKTFMEVAEGGGSGCMLFGN